MKILYRTLKVGKKLNIKIDLTNNLGAAIVSATVTSSNSNVTIGSLTINANDIIAPLTGAVVGESTITVNYASAANDETDCQSFTVNVEAC
jgi:regulator of RNase E activity RraA